MAPAATVITGRTSIPAACSSSGEARGGGGGGAATRVSVALVALRGGDSGVKAAKLRVCPAHTTIYCLKSV
jgi:hypothetical protein